MQTFPYEKPRKLADDLWEVRGAWSNPLGRRMTVVRAGEQLLVHNAIQLAPGDLEWLRGLGKVRWIVAPNKFHCSDAAWMAGEAPGASLYVPAQKLDEFRSRGLQPLDTATFDALPGEFDAVPMLGTRVDETAFIHGPTKTLVLCDLAMNMEDVFRGPMRLFMRWNKVGGRFGVTRLTRLAFTRDKRALVGSYERLFERDFDRVIVNHGAVLESGGRALLEASVREIF